jgi:hypothetical protein
MNSDNLRIIGHSLQKWLSGKTVFTLAGLNIINKSLIFPLAFFWELERPFGVHSVDKLDEHDRERRNLITIYRSLIFLQRLIFETNEFWFHVFIVDTTSLFGIIFSNLNIMKVQITIEVGIQANEVNCTALAVCRTAFLDFGSIGHVHFSDIINQHPTSINICLTVFDVEFFKQIGFFVIALISECLIEADVDSTSIVSKLLFDLDVGD